MTNNQNTLLNGFTTDTKPTIADMNTVVMKKEELLKKLFENKAKHDAVYAAAVDGYWNVAKDNVEKKKKSFYDQVASIGEAVEFEFTRVLKKIESKEELPSSLQINQIILNTNLGLKYPDNHSEDYERAITMMEASIFDTVNLSVREFDSYVRGRWEWHSSFIAQNAVYLTAYSGCIAPSITGCSPAMSEAYNRASNDTMNAIRLKNFNNL
jgi:hypothetical protein